jgi:hypothetical protein
MPHVLMILAPVEAYNGVEGRVSPKPWLRLQLTVVKPVSTQAKGVTGIGDRFSKAEGLKRKGTILALRRKRGSSRSRAKDENRT